MSIHPNHIGCSVEEAVGDIERHWRKSKRQRLWLPNTTTLPDLTPVRMKQLKTNLRKHDCPSVASCARIIGEILWGLMRTLPIQCERGQISIRAVELQAKCVRKEAKMPLFWLDRMNVLRIADARYVVGKKTKLYFVNIPLVLWLVGYESEELDWGKMWMISSG